MDCIGYFFHLKSVIKSLCDNMSFMMKNLQTQLHNTQRTRQGYNLSPKL